jgi:hypothetical protein
MAAIDEEWLFSLSGEAAVGWIVDPDEERKNGINNGSRPIESSLLDCKRCVTILSILY